MNRGESFYVGEGGKAAAAAAAFLFYSTVLVQLLEDELVEAR